MFTNPQEAKVVSLAMHINEDLCDLAEQRDGDSATIDPGHRAPGSTQFASQPQRIGRVLFQPFTIEDRRHSRLEFGGEEKHAFDRPAISPSAYRAAIGTLPQNERDSIDQNRFTCTRLTCKDVESRLQGKMEFIDNGEVFDVQFP